MSDFGDFVGFLPLPAVDLRSIAPPVDGFVIPAPSVCQSNFAKGEACQNHYSELSRMPDGAIKQCPFGFCSMAVSIPGISVGLTGLVPYPRMGGDNERKISKAFPKSRIALESVHDVASALKRAAKKFSKLEHTVVRQHSMALHEIRKLNRTVKQTAERLCINERPDDPDGADHNLVQIWKTADMMSRQFDVIEILADESLTALPLNSTSEVYRLFDKCARIYRAGASINRVIALHSFPFGYSPRVRACDKTLSIIPTVLIENALKYSLPDSNISIEISQARTNCVVRITNLSAGQRPLDNAVFQKGFRGNTDKDGSGHGLYLAKLVATQHRGMITIESNVKPNGDVVECTFVVSLPEVR